MTSWTVFLILSLVVISFANSNVTGHLEVSSYSIAISNLPHIGFPLLNNYIHDTLHIPLELGLLIGSLGYVSLLLIMTTIVLIVLITFGLMQLICGTFSDSKMNYNACHRISSKIITISILLSLIVAAAFGFYFAISYYNHINLVVDPLNKVVLEKKESSQNLIKQFAKVNVTDIQLNNTLPLGIKLIYNSTTSIEDVFFDDNSAFHQGYDLYIQLGLLSLVVLLSIIMIPMVYLEKKYVLFFLTFLLLLSFFVILITSLSTTIVNLILSGYCVRGVDSQTQNIINAIIPGNCSQYLVGHYLFCNTSNECDPFPSAFYQIQQSVDKLNDLIDKNSTNPDLPIWRDTLKVLLGINKTTEELSVCGKSSEVFKNTTELLCGKVNWDIIMVSTTWQLLAALLMIFWLAIFFAWNRIPTKDSNPYKPVDTSDGWELQSRKFGKIKQDAFVSQTDCTITCFSFFTIVLIGWIAVIIGVVLIVVYGSKMETVNR